MSVYIHQSLCILPMREYFNFFWKEKWFYISLGVICLSLPSTGIIVVSKIALHFSELKKEKRTGTPFQADLNYKNGKMRF